LNDREGPALATEGEASRARPYFLEHEPAVAADLNVDFDVRLGEIHPDVRMGLTNCLSELASEILTRERVGSDSPGPEGERLTGRQGPRSLGENGLSEGVQVRVHFRGGADRHDTEDPSENRKRLGDVLDVDVHTGLVGLGDAFDAFRGEQILDVRDEAVAELPAHESALQGQLAEAYKEDHV